MGEGMLDKPLRTSLWEANYSLDVQESLRIFMMILLRISVKTLLESLRIVKLLARIFQDLKQGPLIIFKDLQRSYSKILPSSLKDLCKQYFEF